MSKKKKTIEVEVFVCDFCGAEQIPDCDTVEDCAVCGKNICEIHTDECEFCEDGILCPICSKSYRFDCKDGGVGVVDRKTKKPIEARYL